MRLFIYIVLRAIEIKKYKRKEITDIKLINNDNLICPFIILFTRNIFSSLIYTERNDPSI